MKSKPTPQQIRDNTRQSSIMSGAKLPNQYQTLILTFTNSKNTKTITTAIRAQFKDNENWSLTKVMITEPKDLPDDYKWDLLE